MGAEDASAESPGERKVEDRRLVNLTVSSESEAGRVRLDYPDAEIWLYATTDVERKRRARSCAREPWTVSWLQEHVLPHQVLYDVGANVGTFSLIAAHRLEQHGTVVAFEPGYASFGRLCDNIVLNRSDKVVIPVPLPLASITELRWLSYRSLEPGQSRHALSPSSKPKKKMDRYQQRVLAMRLDDLVSVFDLPRPNHMKVDVDGAELEVLQGAEQVLSDSSLETIMIEVDRTLTDAISGILAAHGFTLESRHQRDKAGKPARSWYGLFRR